MRVSEAGQGDLVFIVAQHYMVGQLHPVVHDSVFQVQPLAGIAGQREEHGVWDKCKSRHPGML